MKKQLCLPLLTLFLASCAAPTPLPTATATEPARQAPTDDAVVGVNVDRPIKIVYADKIENVNYDGVVVNGTIGADETGFQMGLEEVDVPDQLGGEILFKVAFWMDFYHGKNPHPPEVEPTQADWDEFRDRLIKVQKGELPCSEVASTPWGYLTDVPGLDQQPIPLAVFCGTGEVPDGVSRVDNVELIFVKGHGEYDGTAWHNHAQMPRFTIRDPRTGEEGWSSSE